MVRTCRACLLIAPVVLVACAAKAPVVAPNVQPSATVATSDPPIAPSSSDASRACNKTACKGRPTSELETALQRRAKEAHRCYDNALALDSSLAGKMIVSIKVSSDGAVCSADVLENQLNASVAECVARTFGQADRLPTPNGGCIDVHLPVAFRPGATALRR